MGDFTWYGNRERDIRNDFSIPPKYTVQQSLEALKKPAWTYDFLSHEPYKYACINTEVPADSLAAFVNSQIAPEFDWHDAEWLLGGCAEGVGNWLFLDLGVQSRLPTIRNLPRD